MGKNREGARKKKREEADKQIMDSMWNIFQKLKKSEHDLTDELLSLPFYRAR